MPSQNRGEKTRQKIIETAFDLFHQKGLQATSVDEVLEGSGTGKGQFYHYFASKEALVHAVLQAFYQRLKNGEGPIPSSIETWNDLEEWFRCHSNLQKSFQCKRGCPVGTIANELAQNDELIRQDITLIFEYFHSILARFFQAEKAKGALKPSADPDGLADFCLSAVQGGMLIGKVKRSLEPVENSIAHSLAYLKSFRR